jgi:hypothetical protein
VLKWDLRSGIRLLVMRIGRSASPALLDNLRAVLSYLEIGYWVERTPSELRPQVVDDKTELFKLALARVTGERPIYLEFGVYQGRSMRWWSQHLPNAEAQLIGFDSFEGLPEDWRPDYDAGAFATDGPPTIDDDRVSFEVGWFEDTLAKFQMPEHDQLIINIDCDLYSSTVTVLNYLEPYIQAGTLIYFDEFADRDHEMRAFNELSRRSPLEFRPLGHARGGFHFLFEVAK